MIPYSKSITEHHKDNKVVADIWEWSAVGKELKQDNGLTAQQYSISMTQRERVYKTMPDGSQCWYYKDTLHDTSSDKHKGLWTPEQIYSWIDSQKETNQQKQ